MSAYRSITAVAWPLVPLVIMDIVCLWAIAIDVRDPLSIRLKSGYIAVGLFVAQTPFVVYGVCVTLQKDRLVFRSMYLGQLVFSVLLFAAFYLWAHMPRH